MTLHDHRWYYRLVPSKTNLTKQGHLPSLALMTVHGTSPEVYMGKLVVCVTPNLEDGTLGPKRLFAMFDSYLDFARYQTLHCQPNQRYFYEEIIGQLPQKPHFDLELDLKEGDDGKLVDETLMTLIDVVVGIFTERGYELSLDRDILIYSSHGPKKRSYHLIIDNHAHTDHQEAKALYDLAVSRMPETMKAVVDSSVYGSKQQFRIVGSQKVKSGRIKTFHSVWQYHGRTIRHQYIETPDNKDHEALLQLEASLISVIHNCQMLGKFSVEIKEGGEFHKLKTDFGEIGPDIARAAVAKCAEFAGTTPYHPHFPYKMIGIRGGLVLLRRVKPSMCRLCHRIHENENPFLVVTRTEKGEHNVYFHCRRAPPEQKIFLGQIGASPIRVGDMDKDKKLEQVASLWCTDVLKRLRGMKAKDTTEENGTNTTKEADIRQTLRTATFHAPAMQKQYDPK